MFNVDASLQSSAPTPSLRPGSPALGLTAFLVLLLLCGLLGGCGPSAPEADGPEVGTGQKGQQRTPEEELRREETARMLYEATRQLPPDEKVGALSDLAQVYHDTKIAPQAFMDLVFYLSDHSVDRPEEALAALESFARRRPEVPEVLAAANVMQSVAITKEAAATTAAERAAMADLRGRAQAIYAAAADRLIDSENVKNDAASFYEIGNAYLMVGRYADAEAAWAIVENFEKPAEDARRLDLMIRRADLMRFNLDRKKDAMALFVAIRDLQESLGRAAPAQQRDYVEAAIKELRQ